MKAIIFAGGVGTRLWPLSRKKSPKQFEKIVNNKSTLQLTIDILQPEISYKDIYVATGKEYVELVRSQLHQLPAENVLGEPCRKDVGPAVAVVMGMLAKKFPNEPVIVLWSDHLIRNESKFKEILTASNEYLTKNPEKVIYFGHTPRFASENLGWIQSEGVAESIGSIKFKNFVGFKYRPDKVVAEEYFANENFCWNLGSFATTPAFIYSLFQKFSPDIYNLTEKILAHLDTDSFEEEFEKNYAEMPATHVDHAIAEKIEPQYASVIVEDIGWSDVGAWEALKEALQEADEDNVTHGNVIVQDSRDSLIYNYEDKKMVVAIDLDDALVVNTEDVILVTTKKSVPKIKKLVESMDGGKYDDLT